MAKAKAEKYRKQDKIDASEGKGEKTPKEYGSEKINK